MATLVTTRQFIFEHDELQRILGPTVFQAKKNSRIKISVEPADKSLLVEKIDSYSVLFNREQIIKALVRYIKIDRAFPLPSIEEWTLEIDAQTVSLSCSWEDTVLN